MKYKAEKFVNGTIDGFNSFVVADFQTYMDEAIAVGVKETSDRYERGVDDVDRLVDLNGTYYGKVRAIKEAVEDGMREIFCPEE